MKIIRKDPETTLGNLRCGDTFSFNINNGIDIYIKTCYANDDDILCVNLETGNYCFLSGCEDVFPVQCSVSVKAQAFMGFGPGRMKRAAPLYFR